MPAIATTPTTSPALKDRYYKYRDLILRTQKQASAPFDQEYWEILNALTPQPWQTPTLAAGWTGSSIRYRTFYSGLLCQITGEASNNVAANTETLVFTLPTSPAFDQFMTVATYKTQGQGNPYWLVLKVSAANGNVTIASDSVLNWIGVSVIFPLD